MVDFSHLKAFEVEAKTARYSMDNISINGVSPVLIVSPATDANKPYFNSLLKKSAKAKRGALKASTVTDNRNQDKALYAEYIIKGWEGLLDAEGVEAPFTVESAKSFLQSLPNWLFDDMRIFCSDPSNFAEQLDVEVLAKN